MMLKYILLLVISFSSCKEYPTNKDESQNKLNPFPQVEKVEISLNNEGYLFIDISNIYHNKGELLILEKNGKEIKFTNKEIVIDGNTFDIINDEHLYSKFISVKSYFPEYGIFILKSRILENGNYEVEINNSQAIIDSKKYSQFLTFKTPEKFVLEGYPNPTKDNPLRKEPSESLEIIFNYSDYTYISIEIEGDWLKIRDDKDCYSGESPSEKDIIGWVRWRKNGELILDIRHIC